LLEKLHVIGLNILNRKQKTAHVTCLTSLVEREAFIWLKTLHRSVESRFPVSHGCIVPQTSSFRVK
jgi:hypothetical protein